MDALPCPVAAVDPDGAVLAANRAWLRLVQSAGSRAEATGRRGLAMLFPAAAGAVRETLQAAGGVARHALPLASEPGGTVTWWDLDLVPHPEAPSTVLVTARDVTDHVLARRDAEDARQALEPLDLRLRLAQEAAGIGIWEWQAAADRQAWSPQQFRLHGLDPDADVPPSLTEWLAMVHPDDRSMFDDAMADAFRGGSDTGYQMAFRIRRRDTGAERRLLSLGRVLARAPDGRALRIVGVNLDTSDDSREQPAQRAPDYKAAEAAPRDGKALFRRLTESAPHMIWSASAEGQSNYQSPRWFEYSGQTPDQADGDGWMARLHPDDREHSVASWKAAVATGQPYEKEHRLRGRDGAYRWFLSRAEPLRNEPDGRILGWIGSTTDVADMVAARDAASRTAALLENRVAERSRALTEAAVELQAEMRRRQDVQAALLQSQKLEALGQLTAGVAHDFNNVLAAIRGSFDLIRRRTELPELRQLVELGTKATDRAATLTRQLLDFGRNAPLKPAVLLVEQALRRADELIAHAAGPAIIRTIEVTSGVWPVLADSHQLEIALLNLAINARDAMPDGGALVTSARNLPPGEQPSPLPAGDYVAISVVDTGDGMPPEVAARAAEPFFTTKAEGKGTGLGLPMVRAFAMRSGGRLRIDSRVGAGTAVEIVLPRAPVAAIGVALNKRPDESDGLAGRTILLVDDDESVRQITAEFLRDHDCTVIEAPNAETAMVLSHSIETLDMLVTDVTLPGSDGLALTTRLRAERPDLPVLFITGVGDHPDLAGEAVLMKPFTGAALVRMIGRWIGGSLNAGPEDDSLTQRLRNPVLLAAYLFWRAARHGSQPPRLPDLDWSGEPDAEHSFIVAVEQAGDAVAFRYLRVGRSLRARLDRPIENTRVAVDPAPDLDDEILGSLAVAYRRCARTLEPSYEYARYDFGTESAVLFERLIMPVSDDGERITHLIGLALFSGEL